MERKKLISIAVSAVMASLIWSSPLRADRPEEAGLGIPSVESLFQSPHPVRNGMPVAGEPVSILRTFRIKKGTYPEFYRRSVEEVWPYFEKIGARIVGMWQVDTAAKEGDESTEYDEAILLTRYASVEHWRATRKAIELGGNGPDARALYEAVAYRNGVTLDTSFKMLRGGLAQNGPYYMPPTE